VSIDSILYIPFADCYNPTKSNYFIGKYADDAGDIYFRCQPYIVSLSICLSVIPYFWVKEILRVYIRRSFIVPGIMQCTLERNEIHLSWRDSISRILCVFWVVLCTEKETFFSTLELDGSILEGKKRRKSDLASLFMHTSSTPWFGYQYQFKLLFHPPFLFHFHLLLPSLSLYSFFCISYGRVFGGGGGSQ
jgi:hypothetical protein